MNFICNYSCVLNRFGFVEYETESEAQSMFDKEEDVELDGHTLFLDFAAKRTSMGYSGWEKDLELDESSKNLPIHTCRT